MMACARREPCTSSTDATSMNMTFSACRLDAEYGEYSVGSDGNSACTGLMPTKPGAGRGRQPQQFGEIREIADAPVVLANAARRAARPRPRACAPSASSAGSRHLSGATMSGQLSLPREFEIDLEAVISQRQVRGQRQVAQHEPLAILLVRAALGQIPGAHLA